MSDDTPQVRYWVWTQHGDAEYIFGNVGSPRDAVDRFATNRSVAFGTTIYVAIADNVGAFKVGAVPR